MMASYFGNYFGVSSASACPVASFASQYAMYQNTWQSFPDIGAVTYQDSQSSVATAKARKCLPRQSELHRIESYAAQSDYATFIVWDATLAGVSLKGNGKLTWTDGSVWTIEALWQEHFETQWRCLCRRDI